MSRTKRERAYLPEMRITDSERKVLRRHDVQERSERKGAQAMSRSKRVWYWIVFIVGMIATFCWLFCIAMIFWQEHLDPGYGMISDAAFMWEGRSFLFVLPMIFLNAIGGANLSTYGWWRNLR